MASHDKMRLSQVELEQHAQRPVMLFGDVADIVTTHHYSSASMVVMRRAIVARLWGSFFTLQPS